MYSFNNNFNNKEKEQKRLFTDIIAPIVMCVIPIIMLYSLLAIDVWLTSTKEMTPDDAHEYFINNAASDLFIGQIIPFDIFIVFLMIIAFIIYQIFKNKNSIHKKAIKVGFVSCIVITLLSFTPIGDMSTILSAGYRTAFLPDEIVHAEEGSYKIDELNVEYNCEEGTMGLAYGTGTITNTSEHNWEYVDVGIRLLTPDGGYGEYDGNVFDIRLNNMKIGESHTFKTGTYSNNGYIPYSSLTQCQIVYVTYNINSSTDY